MICDDWVDIDMEHEITKNWKRLLVKLQHEHPIYTHIDLKSLKPKEKPKPLGLSLVLRENTRYVSPPYPYNLRKFNNRCIYQNKNITYINKDDDS